MGCFAVKTKEQLINEYRKLKINDINGFNEVIKSLEVYLSENGSDAQLELVLHMARTRTIEYQGMDRDSVFQAARPAIELLKTMEDGFFEIESMATMLSFVESYEPCKQLMKRALNALDTKLADHERCEATKLIIFCNMSHRLLYSRFYDNEDPKEVETLFKHCTKSGIALCEKMGTGALVLRTILLVRQAVFYENFKEITETLSAIKALDNKVAFNVMQDEVAEFYHKMDTTPPTKIINLFMGHKIRIRREELGLSREELAERVGTSPEYLRSVERGSRGLGRTRIMDYVKALKASYDYLFCNLSNQPMNAITDPKIIKMNEIMSTLPEDAKDHALEYLKSFAKLYTNKN